MRVNSKILGRRLLVLTVILAIGFRGLIPAGFMPDFSGQSHNPFALTVCDGVHHHHTPDGKHDRTDVCEFSVGAVFGFDGIDVLGILPPSYIIQPEAPGRIYSVKQTAVFSNASPRSPPTFS
jgi:hypothetical protein